MVSFNGLITNIYSSIIGERYLPTLKPNGVFINVSAPEWNFPEVKPLLFIMYQVIFAGSASGKI
jgi:hypothetical protein